MTNSPSSTGSKQQIEETARRPIIMTIVIWFGIISGAIGALSMVFSDFAVSQSPTLTKPIIYFVGVASIVNAIGNIALLRWRKIGFYIMVTIVVIMTIYNAVSIDIVTALKGLIGITIISIFLFRGKEKKLWEEFS